MGTPGPGLNLRLFNDLAVHGKRARAAETISTSFPKLAEDEQKQAAKRLIRALLSGVARLGASCALTALNTHVTSSTLWETLAELRTGDLTKAEESQLENAALVLCALSTPAASSDGGKVQVHLSGEDAAKTAKELSRLASRRSALEPAALSLLTSLISTSKKSTIKKHIAPACAELLTCGWVGSWSRFQLLLSLLDHLTADFLRKHWGSSDPLERQHWRQIRMLLGSIPRDERGAADFCSALVRRFVAAGTLDQFWKLHVEGDLVVDRGIISLRLATAALEAGQEVELLLPIYETWRFNWVNVSAGKVPADLLVAAVLKRAASATEPAEQLAWLHVLLTPQPGTYFAATIQEVVSKMSGEALDLYSEELYKLVCGSPVSFCPGGITPRIIRWAVTKLTQLLKLPALSGARRLDIAQFLLLHLIFHVEKQHVAALHSDRPAAACLDTLVKEQRADLLTKVLLALSVSDLSTCVRSLNKMLTASEALRPRDASAANASDLVKKVSKTLKKGDGDVEYFQYLLACLGVLALFDRNAVEEVLPDVLSCRDRADEQWRDVFAELLLSLLARRNCKPVIPRVWSLFSTDAGSSVTVMLETLSDQQQLSFADEDDEEDEADTSAADSSDEEEADVKAEPEEEEAEESADDEAVVKRRAAEVSAALGSAVAPTTSGEESDVSDMDDEAMMKIDPLLAAAFKSMTKGSKSKQQDEVVAFRGEVVHLIDLWIRKSQSTAVLLPVCVPLLMAARQNGPLRAKLFNAISSIHSNVRPCDDAALCRETLTQTVAATKNMDSELLKVAAAVVAWLLRCSTTPLHAELRSCLRGYLTSNAASQLHQHVFFLSLLQRQPLLCAPLAEELIALLGGKLKLFKAIQGVNMLDKLVCPGALPITKELLPEIGVLVPQLLITAETTQTWLVRALCLLVVSVTAADPNLLATDEIKSRLTVLFNRMRTDDVRPRIRLALKALGVTPPAVSSKDKRKLKQKKQQAAGETKAMKVKMVGEDGAKKVTEKKHVKEVLVEDKPIVKKSKLKSMKMDS